MTANVVREAWNGVLDVVYPPLCLVCGASQASGVLCPACIREFAPIPPPFCDRCGAPASADRKVCDECATGNTPPYAWSQTLGLFAGTLRTAILRLKYEGKAALGEPLGRLLANSLDEPPSPLREAGADSLHFDCVVPVPLHPSRLRQRGFNQAERIAAGLAEARGWRLDTRGLRRIRKTASQTRLTGAQRLVNLEHAFAASTLQYFAGQSVLLVDDVMTTSATLSECATVVQNAGARRVCVVALARGA